LFKKNQFLSISLHVTFPSRSFKTGFECVINKHSVYIHFFAFFFLYS